MAGGRHIAGVDVGGTFTDILLVDEEDGSVVAWKTPTTPDDPARGVLAGLREACREGGVKPDSIRRLHHGTTIATNAMLEHAGDPVGFITTAGFRDVLHIGRHQRPLNYSVMQDIPWQTRPLVRRRDRLTVAERIVPPDGAVLVALDEAAVRAAARTLAGRGIRSIVIGFLFSFIDPRHERRARELVLEEVPDAFVTLSSDISGQFREFERFTTAAVNGFIGPRVRHYVSGLAGGLRENGLSAELRVMTSNGSVASAERIGERPALTLLSGPAGGVIGAAAIGLAAGSRNLITFDVGGTSADIGIVVDGRIREAGARDTQIAGFPVLVPMIDIETIGAGGGSIAHRDAAGGFRVGPRSAGSRPGPACYGHGGLEPTVTDAHVVLGRIDPERFLGGRMPLDREAATAAIDALAAELDLDREAAATGILRILNANMAEAIRSRTIRRGLDPRDFALVAFGGAGPLNAVEIAATLDIPTVIVPPLPGLTSAVGLAGTQVRYEAVRTIFLRLDQPDAGLLERVLAELEAQVLADFALDGAASGSVRLRRSADLRYLGQGYELTVELPSERGSDLFRTAAEGFAAAHLRDFGTVFPERVLELVNVRVSGAAAGGGFPAVRPAAEPGSSEVARRRCVFTLPTGSTVAETPFLLRSRIAADDRVEGPAILLQDDTTIVIPPGAVASPHHSGALIISLGPGRGE